jgi:HD-GYP domain-containing protein (c-di-GMP phosphodiesterase class II)
MNREQVEKVRKHIDVAVNFLQNFKGCPQEVIKIVTEHHERPDGSGFPRGIRQDEFGELSVIFVVAHEFVEMYFDASHKTSLRVSWSELKNDFAHDKFQKVFELFLDRISS